MKYIYPIFAGGLYSVPGRILVMLLIMGSAFCGRADAQPHFFHSATSTERADQPYLVREYDLADGGEVNVSSVSGTIEVVGKTDSRQVRIELYVKRGFALWSSSKSLDNFRITHFKRDESVTASVERVSQGSSFWGGDDMQFNYRVTVPRNVSLDLKTTGGKITLKNVSGRHWLKNSGGEIESESIEGRMVVQSAGGNVRLRDIRGEVKADVKGGQLEMREVRGDINTRVIGGPVNFEDIEGEVRVKTTAGNIEAREISGTFIAQSSVGDMKVWMERVDQGVSLDSDVGSVFLQLPRSGSYLFNVGGTSVTATLPDEFDGRITNRSIEGRLGEGKQPIQVKASSGPVEVRLSDGGTHP